MRNAITLAGCFTALRPRGPVLDDADAARAKRTVPSTSASRGAACWSPASGPLPTTAPSGGNSFGNCSKQPGSSRLTVRRTGPTSGNAPHQPTPTSHPGAVLLLQAVAERQRWKAEYTAAQPATSDPAGAQGYQRPEGRVA
jgi:hypothetical protein